MQVGNFKLDHLIELPQAVGYVRPHTPSGQMTLEPRTILMSVVCLLALGLGTSLLVAFIYTSWKNPAWEKAALEHPQGVVGIPFACLLAFAVVSVFQTTAGEIQFTALGFTFKGAAGPILMWVLCFLSVVTGLRILWPPRLSARTKADRVNLALVSEMKGHSENQGSIRAAADPEANSNQ